MTITEMKRLAAVNQRKYAAYPRKRRLHRIVSDPEWYHMYATVFADNKWQEILWDITPRKGVIKRRPTSIRSATDTTGRTLSYREWALLKNKDYYKLATALDNGTPLEDACNNIAEPFAQNINLFVPEIGD